MYMLLMNYVVGKILGWAKLCVQRCMVVHKIFEEQQSWEVILRDPVIRFLDAVVLTV